MLYREENGMNKYDLFRKITSLILAITYSLGSFFGFFKSKVNTVSENGSLVTTDSLGRKVVSAGESQKKVGMFYFLCLGNHGTDGPYDNTKIVSAHPDATLSEENWRAAGGGPLWKNHFWGEPLFGYYFARDPWVVRRHLQMLTDAGIDFIVFDTTNAVIYPEEVKTVIDIWHENYLDGIKVPKIAFYTNYESGDTMNRIYDSFYNNDELKSLYPKLDELWFRIDEKKNAKPMIIGDANDEKLRNDVKEFFRIKANQWPTEDKKSDGFPWMEFNRNLTLGAKYKNSLFDKSIANVSAAQHCETVHFSATAWYGGNDHTRSCHDGALDTSENAVLYGYNFQEQWDFACKLDPDIVFVTGWNEWIAVRGYNENVPEEPILFCDAADTECSRDCEPSAGILGDSYYMQIVSNVSKFKKSTSALPKSEKVSIDINGDFSQWDNDKITSVYRDYKNDTVKRDFAGYGDLWYTDDSGRNDIVNMKAVQDENKMYFYVETAQSLSSPDGGAWMTLFINTSGKEGYDFCINRTAPSNGETAVERIEGEQRIKSGSASIKYAGNRLMISVPKSLLDISGDAEISFKWADNYVDGDIYSFYTRGDAAPYGRLNYTFK